MSRVFLSLLSAVAVTAALGASPVGAQYQTAKPLTDDQLEDRIEHRLETNAAVRKYDIKVEVKDAEAVLTGTVATDAQKSAAEQVAKIAGIQRVQNALVVDRDVDRTLADRAKAGLAKTGEAINDAWITTKVKWFFVGDDLLEGSDINVDTKDRVVTLKGTVRTQPGRERAIALATGTDGVSRVVDQLTIK